MTPTPYQQSAAVLDLSPRVFRTGTVAASPAAGTETIVGSLTINAELATVQGIYLFGFAAFTMGTNGVSYNLKVRKTDASGSTLKASGLVTAAAAELVAPSILALDPSPTLPNQVYVLTLLVTSGSAPSTVSGLELVALVV